MDLTKFKNKKVLITNHNLVNFAGSELTTFYLAKVFLTYGANVAIATFCYDNPIKQIFEAENIQVYNLLEDTIPEKCYDLIWAHHSPALSDCIFEKNISAKKIIFSSLSPFEPLEAPPVYANLLSLCLANSCETRDKLIEEGINKEKIYVFNNSVDSSYLKSFLPNKKSGLKKICVISNHVPKELRDLEVLLTKSNITCDIYGIFDKPKLIDAKLLVQYDAIISIGRSVQYGLATGIPVYCYDRFGGPGWINSNNIKASEYYNFSGRCSNRQLDAEAIYSELIDGYHAAYEDRNLLHKYAEENYSIDCNISKCLDLILKKPFNILLIFENFYMTRRINEYYEQKLEVEISKNTLLNAKDEEIRSLTTTLSEIYSSRGWRLLNQYYKFKKTLRLSLSTIFAIPFLSLNSKELSNHKNK